MLSKRQLFKFGYIIFYQNELENEYLKKSDRCSLRSSCITMAKYWGIGECFSSLVYIKGTSCVIAFIEKGFNVVCKLNLITEDSKLVKFVNQKPPYIRNHNVPGNYVSFWKTMNRKGIEYAIKQKH